MPTSDDFAYMSLLRPGLPVPATPAPFRKYNFGTGHNDPDLIPTAELAAATKSIVETRGQDLAKYNLGGSGLGVDTLRVLVSQMLARRGARVGPDNVLITNGSAQGLDLVNQIFVSPGDTVVCEEYTYSGVFTKFNRLDARYVGTRLDDDGIVPESLDNLILDLKSKGNTPRYLYAIPTIQNPTGTIMSLERRVQLLKVARAHHLPILEDECYADVTWTDTLPPCLYSLEPSQVIHISTFSKSLAPALRVGFLVAQQNVLFQLQACKNDGGTGAIDQLAVVEFFGGRFEKHLKWVADTLEAKADAMIGAFSRHFGSDARIRRPLGGIYLWVTLPTGVDTRHFMAAATAASITYNPGPEWACNPDAAANLMRLCFAMPTLAEIEEGVYELSKVYKAYRTDSAQSAETAVEHAN